MLIAHHRAFHAPATGLLLWQVEMNEKDISNWRKVQRQKLRAMRAELSQPARNAVTSSLEDHLDAFFQQLDNRRDGTIVGGYWPIQSEFDLRPWLIKWRDRGLKVALPVVIEKAAPLIYRTWSTDTVLERGVWNILVPREGAAIQPDIVLAPLVGWDKQGYRLGYGGGYFDRTLAATTATPLVIGVGLQATELETIQPQPHDIPMTVIITEAGQQTPLNYIP